MGWSRRIVVGVDVHKRTICFTNRKFSLDACSRRMSTSSCIVTFRNDSSTFGFKPRARYIVHGKLWFIMISLSESIVVSPCCCCCFRPCCCSRCCLVLSRTFDSRLAPSHTIANISNHHFAHAPPRSNLIPTREGIQKCTTACLQCAMYTWRACCVLTRLPSRTSANLIILVASESSGTYKTHPGASLAHLSRP